MRVVSTDRNPNGFRRLTMLVLARKRNEGIRIGKDVRVIIVATSNGKVRLGIEAPKDVTVHRDEIYEAILRGGPRRPHRSCA
jgi:carbon storage regulator